MKALIRALGKDEAILGSSYRSCEPLGSRRRNEAPEVICKGPRVVDSTARAVPAAIRLAIALGAVADYATPAARTGGRHFSNRAFKRVESVRLTGLCNRKRFVVVLAAAITCRHD